MRIGGFVSVLALASALVGGSVALAQSDAVIEVLHALVEYYTARPGALPSDFAEGGVRSAVAYVAGMTDRFAFETAAELLGWDPDRLPKGIGRGA